MKIIKKSKNDTQKNIGIYGLSDLLLLLVIIVSLLSMYFITKIQNVLALLLLFVSGVLVIVSKFVLKKHENQFVSSYTKVLEAIVSVFAFGITPIFMTMYFIGLDHLSTLIVLGFYIFASIISTAYNLTLDFIDSKNMINVGLPLFTVSVLYPLIYIIVDLFGATNYEIIFTIALFLMGVLYLSPIKIKKYIKK